MGLFLSNSENTVLVCLIETEEPERDTSTERQTDQQQTRLSVLEQLQYQLTTQVPRPFLQSFTLHILTDGETAGNRQPSEATLCHKAAPCMGL